MATSAIFKRDVPAVSDNSSSDGLLHAVAILNQGDQGFGGFGLQS